MIMPMLPKRAAKAAEQEPTPFKIMCAWCNRVRRGYEWRTEPGPLSGPNISHGICPKCFRQQVEHIKSRR